MIKFTFEDYEGTTELFAKPCPICGHDEEIRLDYDSMLGGWCLVCTNCGTNTGYARYREAPFEAWNDREDSIICKDDPDGCAGCGLAYKCELRGKQ